MGGFGGGFSSSAVGSGNTMPVPRAISQPAASRRSPLKASLAKVATAGKVAAGTGTARGFLAKRRLPGATSGRGSLMPFSKAATAASIMGLSLLHRRSNAGARIRQVSTWCRPFFGAGESVVGLDAAGAFAATAALGTGQRLSGRRSQSCAMIGSTPVARAASSGVMPCFRTNRRTSAIRASALLLYAGLGALAAVVSKTTVVSVSAVIGPSPSQLCAVNVKELGSSFLLALYGSFED